VTLLLRRYDDGAGFVRPKFTFTTELTAISQS